MATGGSEETFDFTCTPCYKDGKHVEASVFCEECRECLCEGCYSFHQRFTAMVVHKVLDKAAMLAGGAANIASLPTDTCDIHTEKLIVVHCTDHDVLCCSKCVSANHRSCSTVYIPKESTDFRDSTQMKDQTASTNSLVDELDKTKVVKQKELHQLRQDKNKILTEVHKVTNDFIQRIYVLEGTSVDMVKQAYDPVEAKLEKEISYFEGAKTDTQSVLGGLGPSVSSEAQLYINKIRARWHHTDMKNTLSDNISQKDDMDKVLFFTNTDVTKALIRLKELDSMVEKMKIYSAKLKEDYSVKVADDKTLCDITASCQLPDGTVVITDWNNMRIKRLNDCYSVTNTCALSGLPWDVACTAPDEVAATMTDLKIVQFVKVKGSMSLSRSFPTSDKCRGIVYSGEKLYVACGGLTLKGQEEGPGHVAIYTLKGEHLNKVQTDPTGQNIFSCPYHVTASCDGDKIYVAQSDGGVVRLERNASLTGTVTDSSLITAYGVCTIDSSNILVCGYTSNNVLQFDVKGRKTAELLKNTDGIKKPTSLCYDSRNARLIVTMENTDNIKVFDLKQLL